MGRARSPPRRSPSGPSGAGTGVRIGPSRAPHRSATRGTRLNGSEPSHKHGLPDGTGPTLRGLFSKRYADFEQGAFSTAAPLAVKDRVIRGTHREFAAPVPGLPSRAHGRGRDVPTKCRAPAARGHIMTATRFAKPLAPPGPACRSSEDPPSPRPPASPAPAPRWPSRPRGPLLTRPARPSCRPCPHPARRIRPPNAPNSLPQACNPHSQQISQWFTPPNLLGTGASTSSVLSVPTAVRCAGSRKILLGGHKATDGSTVTAG